MSDAPVVKTAPKKKVAKPKKPAAHPQYAVMIKAAVSALKERGGSSRQAILKYINANYNVGNEANKVNARVKLALKSGVKNGLLKQSKGTGAAGSFRLGEKKAETKPKAKKVTKPKAKKPKAAKKATGEKKVKKPKAAKPKKAKSPKKVKTAKKAAKPKAKTPSKKTAQPKKAKTPKKK